MSGGRDIVVAGAGAVGSTVGLALARAGHRVVVVDPASLGANASGVAAGMLAPAFEALFDQDSQHRFSLFTVARDLWPDVAQSIGLPLAREGAMAVGGQGEVEAWAARLGALGARRQALGPNEVAQLSPGLRPSAWAVYSPEDWRLDPVAALRMLRSAAEAKGVRFITGRLTGFGGGQAMIDGQTVVAERLVVATGAGQDMKALAPELTHLAPVKGHVLRAGTVWPTGPVVRTADAYLCRTPGELVLGASMEPGLADTVIDPAVVAALIGRAAGLAPELGQLPWRASTGVRAATPDGLPMVGASSTPGVILAVGARRNGWLLAPMIAEAVVRAVEGGAPAALFDPGRY